MNEKRFLSFEALYKNIDTTNRKMEMKFTIYFNLLKNKNSK